MPTDKEQANKELQDALKQCGEGKSAVKGALVYALDAIEEVDTKGFRHPDVLSMMDLPQRRYDCHSCHEGSDLHTRDEVILRANGDLIAALHFIDEAGGTDEDSPLLPISGAVLHALDELQLLGVEGFKHPDETPDDVADERRIWRAAQEDRASIRFMFGDSPLARKG